MPRSSTNSSKPEKHFDEIKALFKRHDTNRDGRLSKKDLKRAFEELGVRFPAWRAWRGICKADANGDGFISSEQEYKDLVDYAKQFIYPD